MNHANQAENDVVGVIEIGINRCILAVGGKRVLCEIIRSETQK